MQCNRSLRVEHLSMPAIVLAAFAILAPSHALSQEAEADIEAYCSERYGAGTVGDFDRRDNNPLCTEKTHQGLGLLHHRVDAAEICQAQHQTGRYRQEGPKVICLSGDATATLKEKVDLGEYCRESYGETAIVSRRLTDNAPLCTVKGDGGLSQTHHVIDTRQLCGGDGAGLVADDTLDCGGGAATAGGSGGSDRAKPSEEAPGPGKQRIAGEAAPKQASGGSALPEGAIIPISEEPDLTGCGFGKHPPLAELTSEIPPPPPLWESGADATPCPALGGGFKPDLDAFCANMTRDGVAGFLPDGRPICHPRDNFPGPLEAPGYWLMIGGVCHIMYPDDPSALWRGKLMADGAIQQAEGHLIPVTKFADGEIECFYLSTQVEKTWVM